MPHILILVYDQNGNQIGEYYPPHEEGGDLAERQGKMVLDLEKIAELMKDTKK